MENQELIKVLYTLGEIPYLGTCRQCYNDLVPSEDQEDVPPDEILLECSILGHNNCVAREAFKLKDVFKLEDLLD